MNTEASHKPHILDLSVYLNIGFILLILTAVTVAVSYIDLGAWNVVVAIFIASIKATFVLLFFMHLYYDRKIYLVIFLTAILFLAIFIGFIMFDTLNRGDIDKVVERPINPNAIIYNQQTKTDSDSTNLILDSTTADEDTHK